MLDIGDNHHATLSGPRYGREEVQCGVESNNRNLLPVVRVGYALVGLENGAGGSGDHPALDGTVADIDQEHINERLGRPDEALSQRNKVDSGVVELGVLPSVSRLIVHRTPVEVLRDLVAHPAEDALVLATAVDEHYLGADVRPTASATHYDRVSHNRYFFLTGFDGPESSQEVA